MWKFIAAVAGVAALSSCGARPAHRVTSSAIATGECPTAQGKPMDAPLHEIIKSPAAYHGRLVRLSGVYRKGFEVSAIVPASAPSVEPSPTTGIWSSPLPEGLEGRPLELLGYFTSTVRGHGSQWPGSLCVVSWSPAGQDAP